MSNLTRSSSLMHFEQHARANGLDPEVLLRRTGIPVEYLHERDMFVSYRRLLDLFEICAEESANPKFGAELGLLQGLDVLGPIAYLLKSSTRVGDALKNLIHYFHLQTTGARICMEVQGHSALMSYDLYMVTPGAGSQGVELACAIGVRMMRAFVSSRWHAQQFVFQHERLGEMRRYQQIFGIAPRFNGEFNGFSFDARLLDTPIADSDPALHRLMAAQLEAMNDRFRDDLQARIQAVIRAELPGGDIGIDHVAARLAMSARSLQRYLKLEGSSYQSLLDSVRRDIAEHYLRASSLRLTQISELLAYRDLSNFSRAFVRWHKISPRQWRRANGSMSPPGIAYRRAGDSR